MTYRPWQTERPNEAKIQALCAETGLPRLVCGVLLSRGHETAAEAQAALGQGLGMSDPFSIHGMHEAVQRILRAVDTGERIVVFGDYDVDGVTATALLYSYLDSLGAQVYYKLPSREDDGYGLSCDAVQQMARKGVTLIITVDNGICANDAIEFAAAEGVDVVVTDHHLPPERLPPAAALVNPQLDGPQSPCRTLCGAGVAFYLIAALEGCPPDELLPFYGDLAAIGTIADIMPLTGENRILVKAGLAMLQHTERAGLAALIESCGMMDKEITAENVSFGISPRLNAAGRMDSATAALELLLCDDIGEAQERAAALEEQNAARQAAEQAITAQVTEAIEGDVSYRNDRILVVAGEGFHQGVIGIVASRILERYGKPTIIISIDENGEGKGSGRSFAGVSLHAAITACSALLIRYGGHALAAGLSVARENIAPLRAALNAWALEQHPSLSRPPLVLDTPVKLAGLTADEVNALHVLAPFGSGNHAPLFLLENAVVEAVYPVSEGKHTRVRLRQGSATLYAVLFGQRPETFCYRQGDAVDVALSLSVYEGKTGPVISGRIKDIRPAGLAEEYVRFTALYEAMQCSAPLSAEEKKLLLPARADTVAVYRAVQSAPINAGDLRPLFQKLGAANAGRTLVSLCALEELGLIVCRPGQSGAPYYTAVPAPEKKELASAPVLRRLEG